MEVTRDRNAINRLSRLGPEGTTAVVSEHAATTTIAPTGEWGLLQQPATREVVRLALDRNPESIVLDLSCLSFIDSSGVHAVIELHTRTREHGIELVIVPGPERVQRLFDICQLLDVLPFAAEGSVTRAARPRRARPALRDLAAPPPPPAAPAAPQPPGGRRRSPFAIAHARDPR